MIAKIASSSFKTALWDRIHALIKGRRIATMQDPCGVPGVGFVMVKCYELDEITAEREMLFRQLWTMDHDFVELADALRV